ncbi:MAG: hypothetical protein MK135_02005 [Polyangiaceae bacterium]|nr:hypothetical protein [Polyangiaceae bacterium]
MTKKALLWVLHPDAERELAARHSYEVKSAYKRRIEERRKLFEGLSMNDAMLFVHELDSRYRDYQPVFWCPTKYALERSAAAGLVASVYPAMEVLRVVHDKRFLSRELSELCIPGRRVISSLDEWESCRQETEGPIRTKRPFGYAGKGQRTWQLAMRKDDRKWLDDSLRQGGFVAEPFLAEAREFSVHGLVDADGVLLGSPCRLETDQAGAPVSICRLESGGTVTGAPAEEDVQAIGTRVGEALHSAGYFGAFGIDLLGVGKHFFLVDLNPRFSLGWSIGLGEKRAEALERLLRG